MPEGDSIHKLAAYLAPRLEGRALAGARLAGAPTLELAGLRVERVEARGKHLLIHLEDARVLRSHLGMHGSWHAYARGERWRLPERQASIVLATDAHTYVCFRAEEAELMLEGGGREARLRRRVGPDLAAAAAPDLAELPRRARALCSTVTPLVDVLLDQRVAAGIGNVYKSEVLFLAGIAPLRALGDVTDGSLRDLYASARELLRRNLGAGPRVTRAERDGAGRLWVHRRGGLPCLRCGAVLRGARLGRGLRSTYWCPACQG